MSEADKNGKTFVEFRSMEPGEKLDYLYLELLGTRNFVDEKMEKFANRLKMLNISVWIAVVTFTLNFVKSFFGFSVNSQP